MNLKGTRLFCYEPEWTHLSPFVYTVTEQCGNYLVVQYVDELEDEDAKFEDVAPDSKTYLAQTVYNDQVTPRPDRNALEKYGFFYTASVETAFDRVCERLREITDRQQRLEIAGKLLTDYLTLERQIDREAVPDAMDRVRAEL